MTRSGGFRGQRPTRRPAAPAPTATGKVRRAQMITTYGVGSMIAIDEASYIVAGLEDWKVNRGEQTHEPRLQRALGVSQLYLPPAESPYYGAALRRFPNFYSCQRCTLLQPYGRFGGKDSTCACGGSLIPSRFVLACEDGHLGDFPYWAWVHRGAQDVDPCKKDLRMITTGRTASLRSIEIVCGCGRKASMQGAFRRNELRRLRIRCSGGRPWLRGDQGVAGCTKAPRTMQRGSSAAWFGVVRSSLAIPPWSTKVQKLIDLHYAMWRGESDDVIERQAKNANLISSNVTAQHIIEAVRRREKIEAPEPSDEADLDLDLKTEEYEQLCAPTNTNEVDEGDDFECRPIDGDVPFPEIGQVMLVTRLREVRVLQSFTRVEPPSAADAATRRAALSTSELDWLPAMEVAGEGVFVRLSEERLRAWESQPEVGVRVKQIIRNDEKLLARRAEASGRPAASSRVSARSILIHTLAHLLINEWSLDSGYSASAMRERLYTGDGMAGLLIYTATSDSAGSLGGIVRQGDPARLRRTLTSALKRATWCSADPLCMESGASGSDGLNLAACHVCTLLPETSCELNNTLLDRGLLIGWPEQPQLGFFSPS
ncbi:DrmB family protein [Micromonospora chersina]|uniref:DrmB family protein n=1 Tax=Micromonospora chersina TaxID=47854 RepID=UPI00371BC0CE